jgi:hypothetical protein
MLLLNFSHPFTPEHIAQAEELSGEKISEIKEVSVNFNEDIPFIKQVITMVDSIGLTPQQWQTLPILLNLPSLNFITAGLLAELHGRMGYFPACLRLQPVKNKIPVKYKIMEILNLQQVRESARSKR